MENIKVIIWGFGAMGQEMARILNHKKGIEIVGVCDLHPNRVGLSINEVLGMEFAKNVTITSNIDEIAKEGFADVALLATDSFTKNAFDKIVKCLNAKMNVISTAEEMAYPQAQQPELAKQLDEIAKANGVSVLGTGINPGFVLDLLIIALSGTCANVDKIIAKRVNDLAPFGHAVMEEQGVGVSKEAFIEGVNNNTIAGHVGFDESIMMISDGLGFGIDNIVQTREPIMTTVPRKTQFIEINANDVAGCRQVGIGSVNGANLIEMDHPQQICPELENVHTGDYITIEGTPNIKMSITPEIPGGIGTAAMCINSIIHVINAKSGLRTMLDIPVPRCIHDDFRNHLDR